jgi:hypothetical protein
MAECFGGGEYGKKMAELITRIQLDQPLHDWVGSNLQNHSNPIKPN